MGFSHRFGHDGFLPIEFCRSSQGNYGYVLIQSYGLGFMNSLTCIYMYCNIERIIMNNQSGTPSFWIQGKISFYISFMFSPLYIFLL